MDLLSGGIDYFALRKDTESERLHPPKPETLNNTLRLTDAGYFDRKVTIEIDENGGYVISQAACSINPTIEQAYDFQGKKIKNKSGKKLKTLKLKDKNTIMDLDVRWAGYDMTFRVIAFWYKKKKRIGYLVTNLPGIRFQHLILWRFIVCGGKLNFFLKNWNLTVIWRNLALKIKTL